MTDQPFEQRLLSSFRSISESDVPYVTRSAIDQLLAADADMEQRHKRRMAELRAVRQRDRRDAIFLTALNLLAAIVVIWTVLHP